MRRLVLALIAALPTDVRKGREREIASTFHAAVAAARRQGRLAAARTWLAEVGNLLRMILAGLLASHLPEPDGFRAKFTMSAPQPVRQTRPALLGGLVADLRYVLRVLLKSPAFTAVAVCSLAIGIGANAAIYSVIRVLLLDPMAVRAPEELSLVYWYQPGEVRISSMNSSGHRDPETGLRLQSNYSYPIYDAMRRAAPEAVEVAGFNFLRNVAIAVGDRPPVIGGGLLADGRFLSLLAPRMAMGRVLNEQDDATGAPLVAVISHRFWMRAFGGDPAVVNQAIRLNGLPATIVGVTAPEFQGISKGGFFPQSEITVPLAAAERLSPQWVPQGSSLFASERHFWVRVIARTPKGSDRADAMRQLARVIPTQMGTLLPPGAAPATVHFLPGARGLDQTTDDTKRLLYLLLAVAGVVLLIACVNLASLLLARGVSRQREIAVRRAMGAGRARLARGFLLEGAVLALAGGSCGLLLTAWGRGALTAMLTAGLGTAPLSVQPLEVSIDLRLGAVVLGLSLVAGLLFSLLPAIRLTRPDGGAHLKHEAPGEATPRLTLGRMLIALQIAVSVPLLVGAVLFLETLSNLAAVDLGFNPQGIAFFKLDPSGAGVREEEFPRVYQDVLNRIASVPGVTSATLLENALLSGVTSNTNVTVDGKQHNLFMNAVGPGFLETMGMRLLAGRAPGFQDRPGGPRVAMLNETAAKQIFASELPLGRTLTVGKDQVEIVGIVSDSRYDRQRAAVRPIMFDAALQRPGYGGHHIVVRAAVPPERLEGELRAAVADVHRDLPVPQIKTQVAQMNDTIVRERVFTQLLAVFGGFGLLLASIGVHGVTAYSVSRRTKEIGVRVALGARPRQVLWMVLRNVVTIAGLGLAAGVPLALAVAPLAGSLLFEVAPRDLTVVAIASGVMLTVALFAGLAPARRAARLDPLAALRAD